MFLLGFISKRVINYTSKYNDDDEGHDDIVRYWMRARTVRVSCDTRMYAHDTDYTHSLRDSRRIIRIIPFLPRRDKERDLRGYYSFLSAICTEHMRARFMETRFEQRTMPRMTLFTSSLPFPVTLFIHLSLTSIPQGRQGPPRMGRRTR